MKAYESAKIGENRGRPRLWLEGFKASLAGFLPGIRFSIRKDEKRTMLTLEQDVQAAQHNREELERENGQLKEQQNGWQDRLQALLGRMEEV